MSRWNGKKKAVTFSFDDGLQLDKKLIGILNRFGMKGTFNISSAILQPTHFMHDPKEHFTPDEVREAYAGHEVAGHTLDHPRLNELSDEEIVRQVEEDRQILSGLCGYEVVGFAYPYGIADDRIVRLIAERTGIRYGRLTDRPQKPFDPSQPQPLLYQPSLYIGDADFDAVVETFLRSSVDQPSLLCIWGHTRDFGQKTGVSWEMFEKRCETLSGRDDIFYGTNKEVLL